VKDETEITVRFNEADPLGIVWHGHYIRYFEDGRESFGKKYGLTYLDFHNNGIVVPIVSVDCSYKKSLRYGESVIVETNFVYGPAAKLKFNYRIYESKNRDLVATGSSIQVFVDSKTFDLHLTFPEFFEQWKTKWDIR